MSINYEYVLALAGEMQRVNPDAKILDYGCGQGEVVERGKARGLQIYGADVFYKANPDTLRLLETKGLLGPTIRKIENDVVPFEDGFFDLVVTNMVLEHVHDLDVVLGQIERVLKPGGLLVALFPTQEVWRETHTGLPFVHWFKRGSARRRRYALVLRTLGFGTFKSNTRRVWVDGMLNYLDTFVFYRRKSVVVSSFQKIYRVGWIERDAIRYRMKRSLVRPLTFVIDVPGLRWIAIQLFRRLAFIVVVAQKSGRIESPAPSWLPASLTRS